MIACDLYFFGSLTSLNNTTLVAPGTLSTFFQFEKLLVIKEIAKAKTTRSIGERINELIVESVRIFGKILQRGNVNLIAVV